MAKLPLLKPLIKTVFVDGIEYETETHDLNKPLSEIEIPDGWRLWKPSECLKLWQHKEWRERLSLAKAWFFIEQALPENQSKNIGGFTADSGGISLSFDWHINTADPLLGVRFAREKS